VLGLEGREPCLELRVVALAIRGVVHVPMARWATRDEATAAARGTANSPYCMPSILLYKLAE